MQNFKQIFKNSKTNECHICWVKFQSNELAFCSKRSCQKAFCEKCIQDNFDRNYNLKQCYKKEYFICYVCQSVCKCPFCISTNPDKFGSKFVQKFVKQEDLPIYFKTSSRNKKQTKEEKIDQQQFNTKNEEEEEEYFVFKGTKKSLSKIENTNNNDQNSFKYNCEESSTLESSGQQQKYNYQDEETKSPLTQSTSQFFYTKSLCNNDCKEDQQICDFELNNLNIVAKTTLNRILGESIFNEYDADNDLFEYVKQQDEIQQEDTIINNFNPVQSNQIIQNIKFEEDKFQYKIPQPIQFQLLLPNVIEESDDSEEEICIQRTYSNGVKKIIKKQKKINNNIQNKTQINAE